MNLSDLRTKLDVVTEPGFYFPDNAPIVQFAMAGMRAAGVEPKLTNVMGGSDANPLNAVKGLPTVVLGNEEPGKPIIAGFPWALDRPVSTIFPFRINTDREPMYPDSYPTVDRPIPSGGQDQYRFSLRFGGSGSTVTSLAADVYQTFAATFVQLSDIKALGLDVAKGLRFVEAFYWDIDEGKRSFAAAFAARNEGRYPTAVQAGAYSAVLHYLKAVAAAGSDDGRIVVSKMKATPVDDPLFGPGHVRQDGAPYEAGN